MSLMISNTFATILVVIISISASADAVDDYIQSELKKQKIPGMSIAILKNGKIVKAQGYGFSNIEHQVLAKPETIYQSGSVGKQFTAMTVMMLVEDGKIGLDDPIGKYFEKIPDTWKNITVRHLLTHTSGILDYTQKEIDYRQEYTEDSLLEILKTLPPSFSPGEKWSYSNSGYMLLGFLIHKASGKFYGDLLEERIFGPLGMNTARIINEADIIENRSAGYVLENDKLQNQSWVNPTLNTTADGSLYLTALDMAHWEEGLYAQRLLKSENQTVLWTPVTLNNGSSYPYGFGWRIGYQRGYRVINHSGHWQGFSTGICRYPDFGLAVIMLANLSDLDSISIVEGIAGAYQPELQSVTSLKPDTNDDAALTGRLKKMLEDIGQNKTTNTLLPVFQAMIEKDQGDEIDKMMDDLKSFDFLACDEIKGESLEFFGGKAVRYCNYRLVTPTETHFLTAAITSEGKVTEFSLFN